MKKVALVFVLAVLLPSLILAWLAIGFIKEQQVVFERQQRLLYEGFCVGVTKDISELIGQQQTELARQVETLAADQEPSEVAETFDERLIKAWPMAEVGFVVSINGTVLSPPLLSRPEAKRFRVENDLFLSNQERIYFPAIKDAAASTDDTANPKADSKTSAGKGIDKFGKGAQPKGSEADLKMTSPVETEFRQLIGDGTRGIVPRFLQNRLKVLMWYRSPRFPDWVFGAQLNLPLLSERFKKVFAGADRGIASDVCLTLLDDNGRPVARSHPSFTTDWKRPFVSVEVGDSFPHWEVAAFLLNPAKLSQSSRNLTLTLSLLVAALVFAIGVGSWLIIVDLRRQLLLARQKADFVSNVSHELKTPLTSIRMFAELLAENRIADEAKRHHYLQIITAEAARLTRLINNVLDFARLERGDKQYQFRPHDLTALVRETVEAYRPHLEANGYSLDCELAGEAVVLEIDRDAVAQILVNLLSNAEKYSGDSKEIRVEMETSREANNVRIAVLDRGHGVPAGCEEKIFEQFFRANDSLSSGVQGSGLGLTLARRAARAHGGDVVYRPRPGGGSCFCLHLPRSPSSKLNYEN